MSYLLDNANLFGQLFLCLLSIHVSLEIVVPVVPSLLTELYHILMRNINSHFIQRVYLIPHGLCPVGFLSNLYMDPGPIN